MNPASADPADRLNVVLLSGTVHAPLVRTLPSETRLGQWSLRTSSDDHRATSVPVVWVDPPTWFDAIEDDAPLVVLGVVRRRFFRGAGGLGAQVEVVAQRVARPGRRRELDALVRALHFAVDALDTRVA